MSDLTRECTRYWQRLEKLLEDALIKVPAVASTLATLPARDMIEALIGGERDPQLLAGLARGRMKAKHAALVEALTGRSGAHHAELARLLLDQIGIRALAVARAEPALALTAIRHHFHDGPVCSGRSRLVQPRHGALTALAGGDSRWRSCSAMSRSRPRRRRPWRS
jgi:hypothetical protein